MDFSDLRPLVPRAWPEYTRVGFDTINDEYRGVSSRLSDVFEVANFDDDLLLEQALDAHVIELEHEWNQAAFDGLCLALVRQVRLEQIIRARPMRVIDLPLPRVLDALIVAGSAQDFASPSAFVQHHGFGWWLTDGAADWKRTTSRPLTTRELAEVMTDRVIENVSPLRAVGSAEHGLKLVLDDGATVTVSAGLDSPLQIAHRWATALHADGHDLAAAPWHEIGFSLRADIAGVLEGVYFQGISWAVHDHAPCALALAGEAPGGGLVQVRVTSARQEAAPILMTQWFAKPDGPSDIDA